MEVSIEKCKALMINFSLGEASEAGATLSFNLRKLIGQMRTGANFKLVLAKQFTQNK